MFIIIIRGDKFRVAFAKLGDLRSALPLHVKILVLTATATHSTLKVVTERLCMQNPVIVGLPPHRKNIFYRVQDLPSLDDFSTQLADKIRQKGTFYPKTVVLP